MKTHSFTYPTSFCSDRRPLNITNVALSFEQFRQIHGGDFCELPAGWRCAPGFEPYRTEAGVVIAVAPDAA
jgi:hypothetical protein